VDIVTELSVSQGSGGILQSFDFDLVFPCEWPAVNCQQFSEFSHLEDVVILWAFLIYSLIIASLVHMPKHCIWVIGADGILPVGALKALTARIVSMG